MTDTLSNIKAPIIDEMAQFEAVFRDSLSHNGGLLDTVLEYIMRRGGKRMRPILTLLVAKAFAGKVSGGGDETVGMDASCLFKAVHSACSLELLHTASLVHDDVVDESDRRRGQASVNASFDNRIAVLVGDYILATSLREIALADSDSMTDAVAHLGQTLAAGEVKQIENISSDDFSMANYFDVIEKKTASLFECCCRLGALSAGAGEEETEKVCEFGRNLGILFQIRDDIFDYSDSEVIGKPTGNDLREGKLTLPLLHVLASAPEEISSMGRRVRSLDITEEDISFLVEYTESHGGIDYARSVMLDYYGRCTDYIDDNIHDPEIAVALRLYADFAMGRES
ncbi:MAG: polyprenyl synthetase family protein [Bacteroidales bacterium]|nr:polyprenyl synthetase family protein [Bacteroidales bacterium]MCM1146771.1 polyprenyl synthetase family protein [Bacteroidales bacterium]MCM1205732.1 polyprenyl synthetase family protein [Bacillota bacterium]MCM1510738.1 polyprenyl synthetase family protein [Clostridium sp.]